MYTVLKILHNVLQKIYIMMNGTPFPKHQALTM